MVKQALTFFYRFGKNLHMEARPITELTEYRNSFEPPLSLASVAEKLEVTPATISRWEKGRRSPGRGDIKKIAALVGAPEAQLAGYAQ